MKAMEKLSKPHRILLRVVQTYKLVTPEQATSGGFYSPRSLTTVRTKLRELISKDEEHPEQGYLFAKQKWTELTGEKTFYGLTPKGLNWLVDAGYAMPRRFNLEEEMAIGPGYLTHLVALNDVAIALSKAKTIHPDLWIAEFRPQHVLDRDPIKVSFGSLLHGKDVTFSTIPDSWHDMRFKRKNAKDLQWGLWCELDRGTEIGTKGREFFMNKIQAILTIIENGIYYQTFRTRFVRVFFPTTKGMNRVS